MNSEIYRKTVKPQREGLVYWCATMENNGFHVWRIEGDESMDSAYDLDVTEEQKTVTVRTFAKRK